MTGTALKLTLDSHPKNIAEVEPYVNQVLQQYELDELLFGNILITLTEAVSNAILHGNQAKAHKKVHIASAIQQNCITFTVEDEGPGFDPAQLPDPTAPENLMTPGGRGVFLMQNLSDHVDFKEGGRMIELQFNLH
ncbi:MULTISPECIES: ATP-binding protein [Saprospira]|uniref:ATP-binding protein n=1 Tax=Saprospira TaxID=1007 RepID=UPI0022DD2268|nr:MULTISPECIES: ATP-binding protein [Saprospira]WBM76261.1 ATP-binding protein [Saprospira grandis]WCL83051.1 ATP-binding protein [Saprospira sp. CCB-QB6]